MTRDRWGYEQQQQKEPKNPPAWTRSSSFKTSPGARNTIAPARDRWGYPYKKEYKPVTGTRAGMSIEDLQKGLEYQPSIVLPSGTEIQYTPDIHAGLLQYYNSTASVVPGRYLLSRKDKPIGYYADPLTLDTYNTIIESSDDASSLPDWLPINDIREAHKFLSYTNKGKSVEDWSIDEDSDVYHFLASLESPPANMLFPHQYMNAVADEEYRRKYNAGGMDDLKWGQKALMYPFYSQPWEQLPREKLTKEQKDSLLWKDIFGSGLAAMTTAPMAAIALGIMLPVALPAAAGAVTVGGLMVPFLVAMALANFADRRLELDTPAMASVNAFSGKVLSFMSGGVERIGATIELVATDEEFNEVLSGASEYTMGEYTKTAWQASQMRYEVRRQSTLLDIAGGQVTDPDEIWRIEQGIPTPVKVPKSWKWGKEATNAIQDELLAGAEVDEVLSHWEEKFGFQGVLSDMVMQNIFDPLNYLPSLTNRIPRAAAHGKVSKIVKAMDAAGDFTKIAKAMDYADDASDINKFIEAFSEVNTSELLAKLQATPEGSNFLKFYGKMDDMRLSAAIVTAADQAKGNYFIDALPFPVNMVAGQIYRIVTGKSGSYGGAAAVFENLKRLYTDGYAQDAARQVVTKTGKVKNFYAPPTWTPIERWLGGLDKNGMPRWYHPTILPEGSSLLKKVSIYFGSQTNSSKAIKFATNFMTYISGQMTGLKAEDQIGILHRIGLLEPGDGLIKVEAKLNGLRNLNGKYIPLDADIGKGMIASAMQRLEIDPAAYGSQASYVFLDAVRKAVSEGVIGNSAQKWYGTTDARSKLYKMARVLGVEGEDVLDYVNTEDTATLWKKFKAVTAEEPVAGFDRFYAMSDGDASSSIDSLLKVFAWEVEGGGRLPWNDELFHADMINKLTKHIQEYVVNRYMLTEKNAITKLIRYTNINRQIQGALVLGLNPRYAIYNFINNIITRITSDNFGYMRARDIDNYNKRFGFTTWNDSIDFDDFYLEGKGMDIQKTKLNIDDINYKFEHEWMEKLARGANAVSVFKKLSNNIEAMSARRAYMNGLKKYWDNTWAGSIPGMDDINLPENVKKAIMAKAVGSLNMDEVRTGIFKGNPDEIDINIYTRRVAENLAKDTLLTPEILLEVIDESVMRTLKTELVDARTPRDVATAIQRVKSPSLDFIRRRMDNDFKTRGAEIRAGVKDSGAYAVLKEYIDTQIYYQMEHIAHFRAIDAAIISMEGMTSKQMSKVWDGIELSEAKRFEVLNKWQKNSAEAIFGALAEMGADSRGRYKTHLFAMDKLTEMWKRFYKKRGGVWRKVFNTEFEDIETRNLAYDTARLEVDRLADKAYKFEEAMYDKSIEALYGGKRLPVQEGGIAWKDVEPDDAPAFVIKKDGENTRFIDKRTGEEFVLDSNNKRLEALTSIEPQKGSFLDNHKVVLTVGNDVFSGKSIMDVLGDTLESGKYSIPEGDDVDLSFAGGDYLIDNATGMKVPLLKDDLTYVNKITGEVVSSEDAFKIISQEATLRKTGTGTSILDRYQAVFTIGDSKFDGNTPPDALQAALDSGEFSAIYDNEGNRVWNKIHRNSDSVDLDLDFDECFRWGDKETGEDFSGDEFMRLLEGRDEMRKQMRDELELKAAEQGEIDRARGDEGRVSYAPEIKEILFLFDETDEYGNLVSSRTFTREDAQEVGKWSAEAIYHASAEITADWDAEQKTFRLKISQEDYDKLKVRMESDLEFETTQKEEFEGLKKAYQDEELEFVDESGKVMPRSHADAVRAWIEHVKDVRKRMAQAVRDHRQGMVDDPPKSRGDRLARNSKFYNVTYTKLIMELHNAEIEGAMFAVSSKSRVPSQMNHDSMMTMEAYMNHLNPMLDGIAAEISGDITNNKLYDGTRMTVEQSKQVDSWLNQVDQNMRSNKFQAVKYGEAMKDYTMLDYTNRTGLDEAYSVLFPYQFWYTHSFRNWAMRIFDNTSMFSSFYRFRNAQKKMGRIGVPSRMENKLRIPWAFLPKWAGGSTYFDPYSQLFPPSSLFSMLDVFNDDKSNLYRAAYWHLADMAKLGEITEEQAMKARETGEGKEWDMALEWASADTGFSNPYTLTSQFMLGR
jgi:hypothetical protein